MVRSLKDLPFGLGPRTAMFLRDTYSQDRAKSIARDFRISISTAQRWLDGHAPTIFQLEEMFAKWGMPFIQILFVEAFAAQDARLAQLLAEHEQLGQSLKHPADLLEAARKEYLMDTAWPSIWAPPPPDCVALRYQTDRAWPNQWAAAPGLENPSVAHALSAQYALSMIALEEGATPEQTVPYLIGCLAETIKEPGPRHEIPQTPSF